MMSQLDLCEPSSAHTSPAIACASFACPVQSTLILCETSPAHKSMIHNCRHYSSLRITRSQRSNMYCFVMLEDEHDPDDIQLAFLRIDTLYGYFAMLVMQLMEGINVHVAPPDRIDWWRGSVTCLR